MSDTFRTGWLLLVLMNYWQTALSVLGPKREASILPYNLCTSRSASLINRSQAFL